MITIEHLSSQGSSESTMSNSRVWLITGTSAGIGQASVKEVIAAGERVAAITRKTSSLSELSASYPSDKLLVLQHDVGNPSHSAEALFENVHKHFGRIDVVVNNAGYGLNSVVEATSDEDARYQFEVNFWGAVRISREAVKYFRDNKIPAGRIINVSSVGGFIGTLALPSTPRPNSLSKDSVRHYTRSFSLNGTSKSSPFNLEE
jgi:NAD(P)-dependent dehydrogenase (short-subunit alcohol dehydrogenase family)